MLAISMYALNSSRAFTVGVSQCFFFSPQHGTIKSKCKKRKTAVTIPADVWVCPSKHRGLGLCVKLEVVNGSATVCRPYKFQTSTVLIAQAWSELQCPSGAEQVHIWCAQLTWGEPTVCDVTDPVFMLTIPKSKCRAPKAKAKPKRKATDAHQDQNQ